MRQGAIVPEVDTVFFLSDGAPARDSMRSWDDIQRAVLMITRYCRTTFSCIDFDPKAGNQAAMIQLADDNFGKHESVEVGPAGDFDVGGAAKKRGKKKRK